MMLRPQLALMGESHCPHPQSWQLAFLFMALGLLSLGAGCIRPCNIAFGADQFGTKTVKGRAQLESFFNWCTSPFQLSSLVSTRGIQSATIFKKYNFLAQINFYKN
jgi:hypothetical protein